MNYMVTAWGLNFRDFPGLEHSTVLGVLYKGDLVTKLQTCEDDYWFLVETEDQQKGWVSSKYLEPADKTEENLDYPWMDIARNQMHAGVEELPGEDAHPMIVAYLKSTTLGKPYNESDETPWCSAFVNWCVEQAGYAGTDSAWARSWLSWGKRIAAPKHQGAIVVFSRGSGGHVGFFIKQDAHNIWILGGNQSNTISIAAYPKTRLLGIRG